MLKFDNYLENNWEEVTDSFAQGRGVLSEGIGLLATGLCRMKELVLSFFENNVFLFSWTFIFYKISMNLGYFDFQMTKLEP